jgi:hypothetical protein
LLALAKVVFVGLLHLGALLFTRKSFLSHLLLEFR